jgi:hypothetical protein
MAAERAMPRRARPEQCAQAVLLTVVLTAPALLCAHLAIVSDPDLGWHLRTGEWILQHRAVPRTDPFSASSAGKPWAAYSWLFDLLVLELYQRWRLIGIVAYSSGMVLAITVALHRLVRRLQPDFSTVLVLTLVASIGMARGYSPRPWLFSMLFFIIEMDILMQARRGGSHRELLCLPVLFALWSNLHVQFVTGLIVLGIALADSLLPRRRPEPSARDLPRWLTAIFIASVAAACVNPYGWHIYVIAKALAAQPGVLHTISEMQAMPFRGLADFCILFLALAAAAALVRSSRFLSFETATFAFAALLSFRSQRDAWIVATVAAAILAAGVTVAESTPKLLTGVAQSATGLAACLLLWLGFHVMRITEERLQVQLAKDLPVEALRAVKSRGYGGPLFNDYNWGGFLIWALRLPVSIDGRAALHGDKQIERSIATWSAEPDWAGDPQLKAAALVIGPVKAPLTQVLRMDPHYALVFEDTLAAVFIARNTPAAREVAAREVAARASTR